MTNAMLRIPDDVLRWYCTNLGVEKGSVNDIVGIRVLQQLLKVRPAEQEQFMYYDSFGIVREKL